MNPKFWFGVFCYPDSGTIGNVGAIGTKGHMDAEDDLKFLREGDDKTEDDEKVDKDRKESRDRKDESQEELEENQDDLEEEDKEDKVEDKVDDEDEDEKDEDKEDEDEDEEEELVGALVSAKDLKAKYPDIFKKVPELKAVIYREQQYSQLFADPKEAQEAAGLAETFREMEGDLVSGEVEPLISGIKKTDGADFDKFAANFLPTLRKIDEATFLKVIAVPFKQMLRSALNTGKSKGNKNLEFSAQHIHDFIFGDTNIVDKTDFEQPEVKVGPEEEKFKKKIEELDRRDHSNFKNTVDSEWGSGVAEAFLNGLDKDNQLTKWVKDKMVEDALKEVNKQLVADPRHMKNMEALWRQAKASGYSAESKSRIVTTALARAKQLIPTIRVKLRSDAFAKSGRSSENKEEKKKFQVPDRESRGERNGDERKRENRRPNPKSTASMSDLDVIRG